MKRKIHELNVDDKPAKKSKRVHTLIYQHFINDHADKIAMHITNMTSRYVAAEQSTDTPEFCGSDFLISLMTRIIQMKESPKWIESVWLINKYIKLLGGNSEVQTLKLIALSKYRTSWSTWATSLLQSSPTRIYDILGCIGSNETVLMQAFPHHPTRKRYPRSHVLAPLTWYKLNRYTPRVLDADADQAIQLMIKSNLIKFSKKEHHSEFVACAVKLWKLGCTASLAKLLIKYETDSFGLRKFAQTSKYSGSALDSGMVMSKWSTDVGFHFK